MQYSAILSLLVATAAVAAPTVRRSNNDIKVSLTGPDTTVLELSFQEGVRDEEMTHSSYTYSSVELSVGSAVAKQDLRCQILDHTGTPLVVLRGANTDVTFSDAGKGAWTLREPSMVSTVVCDPTFAQIDKSEVEVTVVLENQQTETGSQTSLSTGDRAESAPVGSSGPFQTVEIRVGSLVANQDLRCQLLDADSKPIIANRNANTDITFSDAGKGAWTFTAASEVSKIICDPTFTAVDKTELEVRVVLQNQQTELGTQTSLPTGARAESKPVGSSGPYQTVEIRVGSLVADQDLRCQLLDANNKPITATRGANVDTTFSDAGKGAWTFNADSEVSDIICDPTFVSANA